MSNRLFVSTRKGLFTFERGLERRWEFRRVEFLGSPVINLLADPLDGSLYAALHHGHFGVKLHRCASPGAEWTAIATPSYEGVGEGEDGQKPGLVQVWTLETGGKYQPGVLWAGTIPGGLFRSADYGESWEINTALWERPERKAWMGGGYDDPGIHSVCVDPRDSRHVTVGVSCGGVWATRDGGESWSNHGQGLFAEYMPPERREDPAIQDPHRLVQCAAMPDCLWIQHHNGIFRSTDWARTWSVIEDVPVSSFGFAAAVHPDDPETAWFVPAVKDECRVPADGRVVVTRTRDGGKSFEVLREGLPQSQAYDIVYRHALDVDQSGECLAFGSTTGSLWTSDDQGDHWTHVSAHLPPVYAVRFG